MYSDLILGLEQLSCLLSIIGSLCIALTWAFPFENRVKHGRILLLWLSLTDFVSSVVYFIQTIPFAKNTAFCKVMALLGIFFPVASFLWTDFIALYLYLSVIKRSTNLQWKTLLLIFHIVAWSTSLVVICFVAGFNHAGKADETGDDDVVYSNKGGWCWISGGSSTDVFIWELIGGKIIEWTSCLIILPFLYTSVYCQLRRLDAVNRSEENGASRSRPLSRRGSRAKTVNNSQQQATGAKELDMSVIEEGAAAQQNTVMNQLQMQAVRDRGVSPSESRDGSVSVNASVNGSEASSTAASHPDREKYACEDESVDSRATNSVVSNTTTATAATPVTVNTNPVGSQHQVTPIAIDKATKSSNNARSSRTAVQTASNRGFFTKFYLKLSALPLVFLFIRLWGSIRIVLTVSGQQNKTVAEVFGVMQAFFDPSQGFFNAVLFVFLSAEDRADLCLSLAMLFSYLSEYLPLCARVSACFAPASAVNKQRIVARNRANQVSNPIVWSSPSELAGAEQQSAAAGDDNMSVSSGISISELLSDFECDPSNRLSDFSFESRLD